MLKKDIHPGPEPVSVWKCEEESGWLSTTYNGCYKKKVGADVITIVTTCLRYFAISEMGKIVSPGQKNLAIVAVAKYLPLWPVFLTAN